MPSDDELEPRGPEDEDDDDSGTAPEDGPLRTIPVRRLPLARDSVPPGASRAPGGAGGAPAARAWQWVPIGALIAMVVTSLLSIAAASMLPDMEEAATALSEGVQGIEGDAERVAAIEAVLDGPHGAAVRSALLAMLGAFVGGLLLAGAIIGWIGRAGALEAGLGTGAFALLSLVFLGGGLSVYALPTPALALGLGWLGARLGLGLRRWRDRRRRAGGAGV